MADVTFFFDPVCPWTWRASRWLTLVAESRGLDVEWRPVSLLVLNGGADEEHGAMLEASQRALRLVEHLHRAGRQAEIARLYTALGTAAHEHGLDFDDDLVDQALGQAGLDADRAALDDRSLDAGVEAATGAAMAAAGPGVGSPVLALPHAERGFHGPVLGAVPDKAESLALWDAIDALAPVTAFFELKRARR
ncbi:MAG TPA: DsbA family protein [Acidimicrobiia bacterium]|nr:DsbA family protein [Acidimicrobiia bacterium]